MQRVTGRFCRPPRVISVINRVYQFFFVVCHRVYRFRQMRVILQERLMSRHVSLAPINTAVRPAFSSPVVYYDHRTRRDNRGRAFCGTYREVHQREIARVCARLLSQISRRDSFYVGRVDSQSRNPVRQFQETECGMTPHPSCWFEIQICSYVTLMSGFVQFGAFAFDDCGNLRDGVNVINRNTVEEFCTECINHVIGNHFTLCQSNLIRESVCLSHCRFDLHIILIISPRVRCAVCAVINPLLLLILYAPDRRGLSRYTIMPMCCEIGHIRGIVCRAIRLRGRDCNTRSGEMLSIFRRLPGFYAYARMSFFPPSACDPWSKSQTQRLPRTISFRVLFHHPPCISYVPPPRLAAACLVLSGYIIANPFGFVKRKS